ncbi:UDP-N-acetylmuramate:L-alanyl-gamma-D-glutamyl-meso-diaminopimelate ligase [Psychrosphaera haliotis]|uniref:UDP-N-acetylmuramate:L-alanyl-gamma-D-glutamyl- meso-diaminopimelate ligase n=1 Tax=Psychrosphaera haliotis TaxID=555083 RepID=UPI002370F158|nr:UDP-N-acetylmuramate:L-alanyl-gamma-D-glutamyl-meso-diaminopimelate ligase [Psychrosphaera haliotis]
MHIHILGICGTFMGGIAAIAKQLGHKVTGSDLNVYPPMSTQLEQLGIELTKGWDEAQFKSEPDLVIIGNAMSRGNPAVEYVLARNLAYTSGPEWLKREVLQNRWVVAASGTHGKTTTSGMVAWLLESCGMNPGYLIGGVPGNFDVSARLGDSPFFVIEADEYDTAFFDKRSKFVHYLPKTLIINNLEFDHADIFKDIEAIKTQFHHLMRILPNNGLLITNPEDQYIKETLEMGCWSPIESVEASGETKSNAAHWQVNVIPNEHGLKDGSHFEVLLNGESVGTVKWSLTGLHNIHNGLAALAAARHCGMEITHCVEALSAFTNAKRRMEVLLEHNDITLYDDFAHHPTAIKTTLEGLRAKVGSNRIIAILEPRSNTMKMGVHNSTLASSWQDADEVLVFNTDKDWSLDLAENQTHLNIFNSIDAIIQHVVELLEPNDHIVVMSNGGFGGIHQKLKNVILQQG